MPGRPLAQKTIGLLGGSSNVATADYYRMINQIANARLGGWDIAETLIAGMNFGNIEALLRADDWDRLQAYMEGHVDRLIAGGADVILCVSNTLHRPLEAIMSERTTPYIHIVDATGAAICDRGLERIILLGTRPAMEQSYLRARYEQRFGLTVLIPEVDERADVDRIIFDELVKFDVREASRRRYLQIVDRLVRDQGAEGVILGCTEIPLLLRPEDRPDLPMFDTARLHCHAAVDVALGTA